MEEENGGSAPAFPQKSEESSTLLQRAVSVLQSSYLHSTSQGSFQYSHAILVENDIFLSELQAFARAKEAAGYSQEELEETFAFLLFDNEEEARDMCRTGLCVNSSSISMLGDPAKGVYVSKHADCLHPRPWCHGKSGYIVICKLIKGKVKVVSENYTARYTCPSPGYDCHVAASRTNIPSETSPFQAFTQSQYYVYEVSDGSAAERPRQICPYIVIACHYQEPKEMPVLARENPLELKHKALYCPWQGKLSIRGQVLCDIALRTPYSPTLPAQLSPSLDISHVMNLSDLRKRLPEAAFGRRNYSENEVCFQGIYFSLYEVEISKKDQCKMDWLVENLKEKDLALIKYLQDQGILILLTSSALALDDGFDPKEPVSLLALFLFTSSRLVCLAAEKHRLKADREHSNNSNISFKIASVLPGLRYALQKVTSSSWGDTTSACIKQHLQEYVELNQNTSGQSSRVPPSSLLSPTEDEWSNPFRNHSGKSFSQLQRYLSDPSSYTLEVPSALGCLTGAVQSLCCDSEAECEVNSSALPADPIPPKAVLKRKVSSEDPAVGLEQSGKEPTKDISLVSRLWVHQGGRKSSQVVVTGTRKKWSPLKMQKHPVGDGGRNKKGTKKKKINVAFSFSKKPGFVASSNEPLLKLANLQTPHRRKRGAEVLSAQFVPRMQPEPVVEETSAPKDPGVETKRSKTLKNPDVKKVPVETITRPMRNKMLKKVDNAKPQARKRNESEWKELFTVLPSKDSSQNHGADAQTKEIYPVGAADVSFDLKRNSCESHALNLLADLALGSCLPPFIPRGSRMGAASCSPPRDSAKDQQGHPKHKSLRVASDHEYHRVDKVKGSTSAGKVLLNEKAPPAEKSDCNNMASVSSERNPGILSRKSSASPTTPSMLPPGETREAAKVNKHSFISSEHSYASQMPEHSVKHSYPRGTPYPGAAPPRNGTRNAKAGPLVGKVLPFRHQQNSSHPQPSEAVRRRGNLLSPRIKEDFARYHTVNVCNEAVQVTCRWEGEYRFHLDSHYTNDPLEKTVIRALHGPWDPDLPDDVEEMKLILHMWVALFYSKPSKLVSSSRKVVEHSNPDKFVSINSTGDFFELSDDGEDCFEVETCPADSHSDPDQTPSSSLDLSTQRQGLFHPEENPADSQTDLDGAAAVDDRRVSSSSEELPCGEEEPSSTSCPEGLSLSERADENPDAEEQQPAVVPEEHLCDVSTIPAEEEPREALLAIPSLSDALGDANKPQTTPRKDPPSHAPHPSTDPSCDAQCPLRGHGEQKKSGWAAGSGGGPGPPDDVESMEEARQGMEDEDEDGNWATSNGPQPACDSLGASPESPRPDGASREGRRPQNPSEHPEGEEEEGSEYGSSALGALDLAFSESSDAEMEQHEPGEQEQGDALCPKDSDVPGGDPVPSPTVSASPCPSRSSPGLLDGTGCKAAGTTGLESPCDQELTLTLFPDSSSVCLEAPEGAAGAGAAPDDQEATASAENPSRSDLRRSSCPCPGCEGDVSGDLTSLSPGVSEQERKKGLVEKQCHRTCANHGDGLEEASGAGDVHSFSFDSTTTAGNVEAEESNDSSLSVEKPSGNDRTDAVIVMKASQEPQTDLHHLLEAEPSSSVREGMSAGEEEHPRLQQSSPNSPSVPGHGGSAPASPSQQDFLLQVGDTAPQHHLEQSKEGLIPCQHEPVGAAEVPVAAESLDSPFELRYAEEVRKDESLCPVELAESSLVDLLVPGDLGMVSPPPPCGHRADPCDAETSSVLAGHPQPLCPGSSLGSCAVDSCSRAASPGGPAVDVVGQEPILPEDSEGGSSTPRASSASLSAGESFTLLCQPLPGEHEAEGSFAELGEEVPTVPFPVSPFHTQEGSSGESPGLSDPEDMVLRAEQLRSQERRRGLTSEDLLAARRSYSRRPLRAAGTRTMCSSSTTSSVCTGVGGCSWTDGGQSVCPSEASSRYIPPYVSIRDSQGIPKNYQNFVVTRRCWGRAGNLQPSERSSRCVREPLLLRSLMGTWGDVEEITQRTLDVECLRFHYKLKQILKAEESPFSTSKSIFPRDFSLPRVMSETWPVPDAPTPRSQQSRSPLRVTVLPSAMQPSRLGWPQPPQQRGDPYAPGQDSLCNERSRATSQPVSQGHVAAFHLKKLNYHNKLQDSQGDITDILDEFAEFDRVMRSRTGMRRKGGGMVLARREPTSDWTCASLPRQMMAYEEMVVDLCSTLRLRLRSVAEEACGHARMFYLVETGKDPFFGRVKALLKRTGHVEIEPASFCKAKRLDADSLLVVIRNEDISSHIHSVPCLLQLKHCPSVVFAGVDNLEDITDHTYQELFHTGGFVVSDYRLLETVTPGQLKEVVRVLERLNRSGRWKWLLHYRENKKLREAVRVDTSAHKKHAILRSCQGADLIEVLHYHSCDSAVPPSTEFIKCLLNLQVQHIGARFAVYLTEQPRVSRELLESKGILVANVGSFLSTLQKAAAPFKQSYW